MLFPSRSTEFTGSDIAAVMVSLKGGAREDFILEQVMNGCVPDFMRATALVLLSAPGGIQALLEVAPDYLCLGTDDDFVYAQCNIRTAQKIADLIDAMLPTKKIVDACWEQAPIKLDPTPQVAPYDHTMASSERLLKQSMTVRSQKFASGQNLSMLTAGSFKDYILVPSFALAKNTNKTCIYGWHQRTGKPIQDPNITAHSWDYTDYSQCPRFISREIRLGDDVSLIADVLADPLLHVVVTSTEASKVHRVPGV